MSHISGSTESFLILLQEVFEAGFSAGFYCEENPGDPEEDWEEFKEKHLSEYIS